MHLARRTVETHLTSTYRKLRIRRRTELPGALGGAGRPGKRIPPHGPLRTPHGTPHRTPHATPRRAPIRTEDRRERAAPPRPQPAVVRRPREQPPGDRLRHPDHHRRGRVSSVPPSWSGACRVPRPAPPPARPP
ncbi:hypothetical protein LV779_37050 [Streptomyces thinghirensis]|nr:hypothetical protein [Streptomyces thinghirensis]